MMFKAIWVAGMSRSGSMWTFNVVRELIRCAGFQALPDKFLFHEKEWFDYANHEVIANRDPDTKFVLKSHALLNSLPPDHLIVSNVRDIRDAVMSFMRFMHVDFERALAAGKSNAELADHFLAFPEDRRMMVRYEEIDETPASLVARLAQGMGLEINDASAVEIASRFSKEKVKALTDHRDQRCRDGQAQDGETLIGRADGRHATIDPTTGFQSDHVSDNQDGDWRRLLTEEQIGLMNHTFGAWLSRHGFAG